MRRATRQPLLSGGVGPAAGPARSLAGCGGGTAACGGAADPAAPARRPRRRLPPGPPRRAPTTARRRRRRARGQGTLADGLRLRGPRGRRRWPPARTWPCRSARPPGPSGALAEAGVVMPATGATTLTCDLGAEGSVALRLSAEGAWSVVQASRRRGHRARRPGSSTRGSAASPASSPPCACCAPARPTASRSGCRCTAPRSRSSRAATGDVPARRAHLDRRLDRAGRGPAGGRAAPAGRGLSVAPAPLAALDRGLAAPRSAVVRVLAWAATDLAAARARLGGRLRAARGAAAVAAALGAAAVPAGPRAGRRHLRQHRLGVHLLVVAAVSRARRARLWVVLTTPLLGAATLLLPYLLAAVDQTGRAVVLSWTLYGLVCRLLPRRPAPPAA